MRKRMIVAVIAALSLVLPAVAWAEPASDQGPPVEVHAADVAELARATGTSHASARAHLQRQTAWSNLLDQLTAENPGVIQSSAFSDGTRGLTLFVESTTAGLIQAVEANPNLEVIETGVTRDDRLAAALAVQDRVLEILGGSVDFFVDVDIDEAGVLIGFVTDDIEALEAAFAGTEYQGLPITVGGALRQEGYMAGGNLVWEGLTFGDKCTAGFAAQKNGRYGMLLAGHCLDEGNMDYIGSDRFNPPSGNYQVFERVFQNGPHEDTGFVQLSYQSDHTALTNQIWRGDEWRSITSQEWNAGHTIGGFICAWGQAAGKKCGWIDDNNGFDPDGIGFGKWGWTDHIVAVTPGSGTSTFGDSGAGWHYSNRAYGIHSGTTTSGKWVYTKIGWAESAIGVDILITDP